MDNDKLNILFVDDEPDILQGYKRMLFSMRKQWSMDFAASGTDALKKLSENDFDVLVTDMKMPGMDGAELLNNVADNYPGILRIVVSGYQDEYKIIETTRTAHKFLAKPCDAHELKNSVGNAVVLREKLENKNLLKILNGIGELPEKPEMFFKLQKELSKKDVSFEKLSNIIESGPGLSAKILQTVNSGFFGLRREINDIKEALSFLGVNTVKTLVLYLETFSPKEMSGDKMSYVKSISEHSLKVAKTAKEISKLEKKGSEFENDAFIAGILHDIGYLVMINIEGFFEKFTDLTQDKNLPFLAAEKEIIGATHQSVGAYLLGIWGFRAELAEAIAFHHEPFDLSLKDINVLTVLYAAELFENSDKYDFVEENLYIQKEQSAHLNLSGKIKEWYERTSFLRN